MKNLMLYVHEPRSVVPNEVLRNLRLQIDNSLELGWNPTDILLFTNFPFTHEGVLALQIVPRNRPRTARLTSFHKTDCILRALDLGLDDELFWYHDTDAYQLRELEVPPVDADLSFCLYVTRGRLLVQGGSMFVRPSARDLFASVFDLLKNHGYRKDEFALTDLLARREHLGRFALLDYSYNLGDTDFELRHQLAREPARVAHFHIERPEHRAKFLGQNGLQVEPLPARFQALMRRHGYA